MCCADRALSHKTWPIDQTYLLSLLMSDFRIVPLFHFTIYDLRGVTRRVAFQILRNYLAPLFWGEFDKL